MAAVRQIFELFVYQKLNCNEISDILNKNAIPFHNPGPWNRYRVANILTNVVYAGDSVWGKTTGKLSRKRSPTTADAWVTAKDVFTPIVERDLFLQAQTVIASQICKLSDAELIEGLQRLLADNGTLSAKLIDKAPYLPPAYIVSNRFDGLLQAYELAGHLPKNNAWNVRTNRRLRSLRQTLIGQITSRLCQLGAAVEFNSLDKSLTINGCATISVHIAKCFVLTSGNKRWKIRDFIKSAQDISIIAKMDYENITPTHFYIIPRPLVTLPHFTSYDNDKISILPFRRENLDFLSDIYTPDMF